MWKVMGSSVFGGGGAFSLPLFAFLVVLARNGHFFAHVSWKRQ